MTDKEQIEQLYRDYWQCMIDKDTAGMDAMMADDYELRHMTGLRQTKEDFFRAVQSGELNYYSAAHDSTVVTVSGNKAALCVSGASKTRFNARFCFDLLCKLCAVAGETLGNNNDKSALADLSLFDNSIDNAFLVELDLGNRYTYGTRCDSCVYCKIACVSAHNLNNVAARV